MVDSSSSEFEESASGSLPMEPLKHNPKEVAQTEETRSSQNDSRCDLMGTDVIVNPEERVFQQTAADPLEAAEKAEKPAGKTIGILPTTPTMGPLNSSVAVGSEPLTGIMPLPSISPDASSRNNHRGIPQKPGAYASRSEGMDPRARSNWFSSPRPTDDSTATATPLSSLETMAGLVEAIPVRRRGSPELQQAQEMAREKREQTIRDNDWRRNLLLAAGLFLAMLMLALVLLVILVPGREAASESSAEAMAEPAPTQSPTSPESFLLSLFPDETILSIQDDSQKSPQYQAFKWLLQDIASNPSLSKAQVRQRYALATLYFATNGGKWTFQEHWLSHDHHECDWQGAKDFAMQGIYGQYYPGYWSEFFPPTDPTPTACNVDGLYTNLWLDQNNLVGSIPEELYLLTTLQTLSLIHNELEATLSSKIGRFTNLDGLAVSNLKGESSGPIPSQIGLLTKLRGLNLHDNHLEGSIPSEFWRLTRLETIFLSLNPQLSGTLPTTIANLSNLRWIILKECNLTGTIPTEIGRLGKAEWLSLEANKITGTLPTELGLLSTGPPLYLMSNQLTGPIPSQLGLLTTLSFLSLRDNQLSGPIPTQMGRMTGLSLTLDLEKQYLTGSIPTELALLTNLQELSLSNNLLSGPLPSQLGLLSTNMGWLDLSNNTLVGTIPNEFSNLQQSLYTVLLEGNSQLSGTVPLGVCSLNGSCLEDLAYRACREPMGFTFDCTEALCGCDCKCKRNAR